VLVELGVIVKLKDSVIQTQQQQLHVTLILGMEQTIRHLEYTQEQLQTVLLSI